MPQKDIDIHLIEDTKVLCKNEKVMIPTLLWHRAVGWYHHYLQHPGHSRLEEMMRSMMYWKGMHTTIRKYIKSCRSCQVNKRHSQKYGHLPPKLVGVVHSSVGQKLLNCYPIKSFLSNQWQVLDSGFKITNYYKCNTETIWPYFILITKPPPNKLYTHLN